MAIDELMTAGLSIAGPRLGANACGAIGSLGNAAGRIILIATGLRIVFQRL